ncbi:MAG: hypothetical protein ABSG82_02030 [Sedimentisphaerales bacterium]|jgi:hypothetical protein
MKNLNQELSLIRKKGELMQKLMNEPDTSVWYKQREGIVQAMGDRVFDKSFDRVFDSVVVAMANLGTHVENMERQSGYISARGSLLPPDQTKQLRREYLVEYCKLNGYDTGLLDKQGGQSDMMDVDVTGGMMEHMMTGLTITLVKQSENQTKVKLRFANTYYPALLQEYYKAVWPAIDKQIFLDKNLD